MSSRSVVVLALLLALLTGCVSVRSALEKMPQRTDDALSDPIRRTHLLTEVGLSGSAMVVSMLPGLFLAGPLGVAVGAVAGVLWYFGVYEFVLEPWSKERVRDGLPSLVGPYWERGPQDSEVFVRP